MGGKITLLSKYIGDAFYLNIPTVAGLLVQVVTLPVILANLSIKDYGLYQFILALEIWLAILIVPQLGLGAKRGIAKGLEGTLLLSFLIRLRLSLIITALVWVAAGILWTFDEFHTLSILLLFLGLFFLLGVLTQGVWKSYFVAKKQFQQFAFWRSLGLVLAPIAGMIAAIQTHSIIVFAGVQFGVSTILSIIAFGYIFWKYPLLKAYKDGAIDYEVVAYGVRLLPASFAVSASEKGANLIIGPFFGFANLAVFSLAEKLVSLFKNLLHSGNHLLYADFAKLPLDALVNKLRRHFAFGLFLAVLITIPFIIVGYFYIEFFIPESYQQAKLYLLILGLGLPPLALRGVMQAVLETNFKTREILIATIIPNLIRLLLIIFAGLTFGLLGVIWIIVLSAWIEYAFYHILVMRLGKKQALRI